MKSTDIKYIFEQSKEVINPQMGNKNAQKQSNQTKVNANLNKDNETNQNNNKSQSSNQTINNAPKDDKNQLSTQNVINKNEHHHTNVY